MLSKLFFLGVSSMGLRTMVTVNKLSYPVCWVRSKDRGHGVAVLSLGNSLGYFIFIPKFSKDLFKQNNRNILVIKYEKLNQKSLALYLRREQNSCGRSVPRRRSWGGFVTRSCPTGGLRDKPKERLRVRLV